MRPKQAKHPPGRARAIVPEHQIGTCCAKKQALTPTADWWRPASRRII